ncbi:MAG: hypothetical protein KKE44_05140 [Proteobacteria bacterium]|nr:hypothetical protein [Pseudomonadota bacterium]MBU1582119.1 hypothetical protein [Pseudomonadota bacterium]MBU2454091.1 hypothetical protein [Pseudomonadota bacterium]MBU2631946.1 hypothetical protein [Pseudomonadota bacterium]
MSIITEYFQQSELAFAAYANLFPGISDDAYIINLKKAGMSNAQAEAFAAKWQVADSYPNPITGVSATVFREIGTNNTHLAIRGTTVSDLRDMFANVELAIGIPSYLNLQFALLLPEVVEWVDDGTLTNGFSVAGHSLGGYVATAIKTCFTESSDVYTFNGPGVGGLAGNVFDLAGDAFKAAFDLPDIALVDGIKNIRGSAGLSVIGTPQRYAFIFNDPDFL